MEINGGGGGEGFGGGLGPEREGTEKRESEAKARSKAKKKEKAADRGVRPTLLKSPRLLGCPTFLECSRATSKQRGELAEMMFMVKATRLGIVVAKPYGDSQRYDFIVDVRRGLWRVQVRSSTALQYGSYGVNLQRHANGKLIPYDPSEIDFLVAFVAPCEAWFVIPVEAIAGRKTAKLCLKGNPRSGDLGKYWEAWGLMNWRWPQRE